MKTNLSITVLFVCLVLASTLSAFGAGTPPATPTPANTNTPPPTNTPVPPTATATITLTPTNTPTPTATPDIAATQKYEGLQATVEQLAAKGVIPSTNGTYYSLDDFSDSFAKSRYYTWTTYPDISVSNFVLQAKAKLTNATNENVSKSGCGLAAKSLGFIEHAIFFSLDGNANYWSEGYSRGTNYLDNTLYTQNPDGLVLTLILSNKAMLFYVNGREALSGITIYGEPFEVGPTILSGTSEGFGTRCEFSEVGLWEIK